MRGLRGLFRDERAEVGVGTLIIFIAMVLVAAVAAAVIIGTSSDLSTRAADTGMEATREVSNNLRLLTIFGERNTTTVNLYNVTFQVEVTAGSEEFPVSTMVIRYADGTVVRNYVYQAAAITSTSGTKFNANWIRGAGTNAVMKSGDLVHLKLNAINGELAPRKDVEILLIPEVAAPTDAGFRTPNEYGSLKTVTIRR